MARETRQRLYCDTPLGAGVEVCLGAGQSHYLINVLRYKSGCEVLVFNGRDGEYEARIVGADKRRVVLLCCEQTKAQVEGSDVMLIFAPLKKVRPGFIAEKATELGVGIIQPVVTDLTQVPRVNIERMRANSIEAAEQTGRVTVPEVKPLAGLFEVLDGWGHAGSRDRVLIFCNEAHVQDGQRGRDGQGGRGFVEAVSGFKGGAGGAAILVGPEGGFSERERQAILARDSVVSVGLGGHILRAETAIFAALSLWQGVAGDWRRGGYG